MATVKKVRKYQNAPKPIKKKVPETKVVGDDLSISNAVRRLVKNPKDPDNVVNQLLRLNPITQGARAISEGITRTAGALGNKRMQKENATRDSIYNAQKKELQKDKKGGVVKKAKAGAKVKDKKWIQKAVNPKHKGYCTPMTKATCTPKRKALAQTFKRMAAKRKGK